MNPNQTRGWRAVWTTMTTTAALLALLAATPARAANKWDAGGGADINWSTAVNWDDNNVPSSGANVHIAQPVNSPVYVNLDSSRTVGSLSFDRDSNYVNTIVSNSPGAVLTINTGISTFDYGPYPTVTIYAPLTIGGANAWTITKPLYLYGNISGSAPVTVTGGLLQLWGQNASFSGGFALSNSVTEARGFGSLGTGQTVLYSGRLLQYYTNALAAGAPALEVKSGAVLELLTTPNQPADRFTIRGGGVITGTGPRLSALTLGSNVWLDPGAVIGHAALDQASIGGLPTDSSFLFGVYGTLNTTVSRTLGTGTPWGSLIAADTASRLQKGTVALDTTGLSEFTLSGFSATAPLRLGSGTDAPTFSLAAGAAIPARINGLVYIEGLNPTLTAFSKFLVSDGATLDARRNDALGGKPVELEGGTLAVSSLAAGTAVNAGAVLVKGASGLAVDRLTAGTPDTLTVASLTRSDRAVLRLSDADGLLGNQERFVVTDTTGLTRGNIVDPWIVRRRTDTADVDFLVYGPTGFTNATYTSVFGDGAIVSGATTASGSVNADSLKLTGNISDGGSGVINLGVLPDGSRAARAGLLRPWGGFYTISPALNAGSAELIIAGNANADHPTTINKLTASNGVTVAMSLPGSPITIQGSGAGHYINGPVNIWRGSVNIYNDGLSDTATLHLGREGSFNITTATGNLETIAGLSGTGYVGISGSHLTLEMKNLAETHDFAGVIALAGNVRKSGTGTQILSGINTYSGATTVNGGTLVIRGTQTGAGAYTVTNGTLNVNGLIGAGAGAMAVNAGGFLTGTGLVARAVTINSAGHLAPGNSPGTLFVADLTLQNGALYDFEAYDLTAVTNSLTLNIGWQLNLLQNGRFIDGPGQSIPLYTYNTAGSMALLPGVNMTVNTSLLGFTPSTALTLTALDGVVWLHGLNVIPEPSTIFLLGVGGWLLARWRRRQTM